MEPNGDAATVTVEIPATPEPETPAEIVVVESDDNTGHAIDVNHAERIAVLENELATLRAEVASASATAEVATDIALAVSETANDALEASAEPEPVIVAEPEPEPEPEPDVEPSRDHPWFKKLGK